MNTRTRPKGKAIHCCNPHCERNSHYRTKSGNYHPFYHEIEMCHRCYIYLHSVMKRTPSWLMKRETTVNRWNWLLNQVKAESTARKVA